MENTLNLEPKVLGACPLTNVITLGNFLESSFPTF